MATTVWSYPNSTGYNHADIHGLEWVNKTLYSTSDGGIYKSTNNADDWTDLSAGLGIRQFYRIACSKTDPNVITTGAQDNGSSFRRTNGSWVDWLGADGMDNIISPTNAAIAIGTSQYGSIYKTINSGASRSDLSAPTNGNWVTPLVMHPTSHDTVYGGWQGVYRSVNGGSSWTKISGAISNYMDALAVAPSNTKYIYASSSSSLYRTTDGGTTWTTISAPSAITSIFVSKNNPSKIWITCNSSANRVFVSTNGGTSFTDISAGLPSLSARSIVVDEDAIETVYVGMNIGVYYRDNVTNTWMVHGTGLPLVAVNEVEIQKSGNKLRVATYGRGVWESGLQNTATSCSDPSSLATTSITASSATLNWSAASGAVSYQVEYKLSTAAAWTVLSSTHTSTTIALSGLSSSSSYNWRVRSNCSSTNSNYVQTSFTTLNSTTYCNASTTSTSYEYINKVVMGSINNTTGASSYTNYSSLSTNIVQGTPTALTVTIGKPYSTDKVVVFCDWNNNGVFTDAGETVYTSPAGIGPFTTNINAPASSVLGTVRMRIRLTDGASGTNLTSCGVSSFGEVEDYSLVISNPNSTTYCNASTTSTSFKYINNVVMGSINNTTSASSYSNYSSLSTNIVKGTPTALTVTIGKPYSTDKVVVFCDWNNNGVFTDAGETVYTSPAGVGPFTTNITAPTSSNIGAVRMRIRLTDGASGANLTSCGASSYGEVEDYTVNITQTPDPAPSITGINLAEPFKLFIYPNPAKDEIEVNYFLSEEDDKIELQIFDMQGRSVLGSILSGKKDINKNTIDIGTLGNGQYILQLLSPNILERSNFIIQK